ncbi:MAG: DGQHR domain-containing protein [Candidatus Staskawiczbacteria bacterium]|nr:DGQHR domain-containing protein [Candidatus Staskawiczbacteria bacterium]
MDDKPFYIGVAKAEDLIRNYKIDAWSISNTSGYQRNLSINRSKKFSDYLSKFKGIFHQTILINIRNTKNVNYEDKEGEGILKIEGEFYLVDGQHRVGGLKNLIESHPSLGSIPVPVLVMVGFSREREAKEFLIVNKTQKGVRADLSDRLLSDVIDDMDRDLLEILGIREHRNITRTAVEVCDKLNESKESVWYKRIGLPNQKSNKYETIKQRSMTESLKYLMKDSYIQSNFKTANKLSKLLIDYWHAVKSLCPKACGDDAKNYVLLKTTGPFILHKLLLFVVIKCGSDYTITKMKSILSNIEEMDDDDWHRNGELGEGSNQKFFNNRFDNFKSQIE